MKLISLNTWGGVAGAHILDFFKDHRDVDIFFLQEVHHHTLEKLDFGKKNRHELFTEIATALPNHEGYFAEAQEGWGLAGFIKKSIPVKDTGDIFVHRWKDAMVAVDGATLGKNIQYFKITHNEKPYTLINFHGLWNGKGKGDTDDRLEQSRKVRNFMEGLRADTVLLCGDFNLLPETKSLAILEEGMRNLIKEYGITSTRSSLYTKEIKFADYILVSPDIEVRDFKVLPDEVSDHLALYLEFV